MCPIVLLKMCAIDRDLFVFLQMIIEWRHGPLGRLDIAYSAKT